MMRPVGSLTFQTIPALVAEVLTKPPKPSIV